MAVPKLPHLGKWLRRYEQNTETCDSRKVIKNVKRGNKAKFDQIPYSSVRQSIIQAPLAANSYSDLSSI